MGNKDILSIWHILILHFTVFFFFPGLFFHNFVILTQFTFIFFSLFLPFFFTVFFSRFQLRFLLCLFFYFRFDEGFYSNIFFLCVIILFWVHRLFEFLFQVIQFFYHFILIIFGHTTFTNPNFFRQQFTSLFFLARRVWFINASGAEWAILKDHLSITVFDQILVFEHFAAFFYADLFLFEILSFN